MQKVAWVRPPSFTNNDDREFYGKAKIGDWEVAVGDVVLLPDDDDEDVEADDEKEAIPNMALLQCMWERIDGDMRAQVRGINLGSCETDSINQPSCGVAVCRHVLDCYWGCIYCCCRAGCAMKSSYAVCLAYLNTSQTSMAVADTALTNYLQWQYAWSCTCVLLDMYR